jgi:hypothetical protein
MFFHQYFSPLIAIFIKKPKLFTETQQKDQLNLLSEIYTFNVAMVQCLDNYISNQAVRISDLFGVILCFGIQYPYLCLNKYAYL